MKKETSKRVFLLFIILLGAFYEYLLVWLFWSEYFMRYHDAVLAVIGLFFAGILGIVYWIISSICLRHYFSSLTVKTPIRILAYSSFLWLFIIAFVSTSYASRPLKNYYLTHYKDVSKKIEISSSVYENSPFEPGKATISTTDYSNLGDTYTLDKDGNLNLIDGVNKLLVWSNGKILTSQSFDRADYSAVTKDTDFDKIFVYDFENNKKWTITKNNDDGRELANAYIDKDNDLVFKIQKKGISSEIDKDTSLTQYGIMSLKSGEVSYIFDALEMDSSNIAEDPRKGKCLDSNDNKLEYEGASFGVYNNYNDNFCAINPSQTLGYSAYSKNTEKTKKSIDTSEPNKLEPQLIVTVQPDGKKTVIFDAKKAGFGLGRIESIGLVGDDGVVFSYASLIDSKYQTSTYFLKDGQMKKLFDSGFSYLYNF